MEHYINSKKGRQASYRVVSPGSVEGNLEEIHRSLESILEEIYQKPLSCYSSPLSPDNKGLNSMSWYFEGRKECEDENYDLRNIRLEYYAVDSRNSSYSDRISAAIDENNHIYRNRFKIFHSILQDLSPFTVVLAKTIESIAKGRENETELKIVMDNMIYGSSSYQLAVILVLACLIHDITDIRIDNNSQLEERINKLKLLISNIRKCVNDNFKLRHEKFDPQNSKDTCIYCRLIKLTEDIWSCVEDTLNKIYLEELEIDKIIRDIEDLVKRTGS